MTNAGPTRARRAPPPKPGDAARALAAEICLAVERDGLFLDAAAARAAEALAALDPRDRGLVNAIALTAWRRYGEIDAMLRARLARAPQLELMWTLRTAAAELALRPEAAHGVVDSAVRRVKAADPRAAGMVNAVLRRIAEAFEDQRAAAAAGAGDRRLCRVNAPTWLLERLIEDWGPDRADGILQAHLLGAPVDLTPRDPADAAALARAVDDGVETPTGSVRCAPQGPIEAMPGFAEGRWWVQDAAAALPATLAREGLAPGARVLDMCAAPGGKTLQLASAGLSVVALDLDAERLARVAENLERVGLSARLAVADAGAWTEEGDFDAVLVDAPCSATGTIRRHPELPWLKRGWLQDGAQRLIAAQDRLIDAAWARLAPGGRLVFCTCSLLKAEGEARAEAFFARAADARPEPVSAAVVGDPTLVDATGRLRCLPDAWPNAGGLDGFFAFRARKASG